MYRPRKEFKIPVGNTASAAKALTLPGVGEGYVQRSDIQVRMRAVGCDCVVSVGGSTIVADKTLTSDERPDGNFTVAKGAIEMFGLREADTHISAINETAGQTGFLVVTIGVGE